MPFTPFHFGPGAALTAASPRRVSFLAFAAGNVLIDFEPGYYMMRGEYPLHRFLHTYVGAALAAIAIILLFAVALAAARRFRLPNPLSWQTVPMAAVAFGAFFGCMSHVALDSIMHADIVPLAPFSSKNVLYRWVSMEALESLCLAAGAIGVVGILIQRR